MEGFGGGMSNAGWLQFAAMLAQQMGQPAQQVQAPSPVDNSYLYGSKPLGGNESLQNFKAASNQQVLDAAITPPASEQGGERKDPTRFSRFFDTLDTNLQSPSKIIGLGLLNQQDPRLALAGLVAMGLLGGENGN